MSAKEIVAKDYYQPSFEGFSGIEAAVRILEQNPDASQRGAVFTRIEIVDFILDLAGYTPDKPLHRFRLLEPSMGQGDFLIPAVKRLVKAWKLAETPGRPEIDLKEAIRAVELHIDSFKDSRASVTSLLMEEGFSQEQSAILSGNWLIQGDFLLVDLAEKFDFVIGNPPYVRQELIPDILMNEYRSRYQSVYDRADLYIPFIERSLRLLGERGQVAFICADRWMKNRYGGPLRKIVAEGFHLRYYIDMTDCPAFYQDVMAYPAITIFAKGGGPGTRISTCSSISKTKLSSLLSVLKAKDLSENLQQVQEISGIMAGESPWILKSSRQLNLVRRLESEFPLLEDAGCKVGIGVASGADRIFISPFDGLDVEPDRKIPLVTTKDLLDGKLSWKGLGIINPFEDDGQLVNLRTYPRLQNYLNRYQEEIKGRHVAIKNPKTWYRTIDRIYPWLASTPKLLIPDIKGEANVVYEDGHLYPHHNLYYITSEVWNLKALQTVLRSGIARLFVSNYSTKMRGGYFRFQAQYLRRIRVPHWMDIPDHLRKELVLAVETGDPEACNQAVFNLYQLTAAERKTISRNYD